VNFLFCFDIYVEGVVAVDCDSGLDQIELMAGHEIS
jgi:hypothetical protein